ncbi:MULTISPECIES: hypothetical protein [Amycolatopsis]|nr:MULTISPECIES: hypothetical protein [Amycolatopsis]OAP24241.1 hypothetical protein A4R44_05014 [Amycolatopsis sp. M39]
MSAYIAVVTFVLALVDNPVVGLIFSVVANLIVAFLPYPKEE